MKKSKIMDILCSCMMVSSPLLFTIFLMNILAYRRDYYDVGIASSSNFFILFIVAPLSLIGFSFITYILYILSKDNLFTVRPLLTTLTMFCVYFCIVLGVVLLDAWHFRDYPNPFQRTMVGFFDSYINYIQFQLTKNISPLFIDY